jgi:hypothetical protein
MSTVRRMTASERWTLAGLVNERSADDAMANYYALAHPDDRVTLYGFYAGSDRPAGFLALARTGFDLFRPLAVPFVGQPWGLTALLRAGLEPNRPVLLHLPFEQRAWAEEVVELTDVSIMDLLRLDLKAYEPTINVLLVEAKTPSGIPRFEIRSGDIVRASAGVNWMGEHFAEVYLEAEPIARNRGFSRSALAAIVGYLLGEHRLPLFRVDVSDALAQAEAHWVGFRRTGERVLVAQALLREKVRV